MSNKQESLEQTQSTHRSSELHCMYFSVSRVLRHTYRWTHVTSPGLDHKAQKLPLIDKGNVCLEEYGVGHKSIGKKKDADSKDRQEPVEPAKVSATEILPKKLPLGRLRMLLCS